MFIVIKLTSNKEIIESSEYDKTMNFGLNKQ